MKNQGPSIAAPLAHRIQHGADAAHIADAIVAIWQEIDLVLRPVLGQRGVAMLYKRSLHLATPAHPWLAGLQQGAPTQIDLAPLKAAIAQQDSANAAAAGNELLHTFHELLAGLIGPSLTERLLRSVWANSPGGAHAQDTTP